MKIVGIAIIVIAVLIAVIPYFNNCSDEGDAIKLPSGKIIPMKCFWTSRASLIVGIPMAFAGLFIALSRKKETWRALAGIVALLSAFAVLLPTQLIGVCADMSKEPLCLLVMKPSLIGLGVLGIVAALAVYVLAGRGSDSGPGEGATA